MAKSKYCGTCRYLLPEYRACNHPDLNGRAKLLKVENNNFVRICQSKSATKPSCEYCPKDCEHLMDEYGMCLYGTPRKLQYKDDEPIKDCDLVFKKKNKYKAKKVTVNGITYDSVLEARRHAQLLEEEKQGKISDLQHHERFLLVDKSKYGRALYYEADFTYVRNGKKVIEDTKSKATKTRLYKLKKRLLAERYGIVITEIEKDDVKDWLAS